MTRTRVSSRLLIVGSIAPVLAAVAVAVVLLRPSAGFASTGAAPARDSVDTGFAGARP